MDIWAVDPEGYHMLAAIGLHSIDALRIVVDANDMIIVRRMYDLLTFGNTELPDLVFYARAGDEPIFVINRINGMTGKKEILRSFYNEADAVDFWEKTEKYYKKYDQPYVLQWSKEPHPDNGTIYPNLLLVTDKRISTSECLEDIFDEEMLIDDDDDEEDLPQPVYYDMVDIDNDPEITEFYQQLGLL